MRWRCHARIESRLHVLRGVSATRDDRERAYFVDALAAGWTPAFSFDREQPNLVIGLNHGAAWSFGRVRRRARRKGVEMPEHLRLGELSH